MPTDHPQGLLQQMNARPHSGEYLEVLGKRAAARWHAGEYKSLTEAVTGTVKQAQLAPEQVKRVVEFANTSAYLEDFKKEGAGHHVVDFVGGPADVSEILKDLNDGGGGSVFDRGTLDYSSPPSEMKTASAREDGFLEEAFGMDKTAEELPYENPYAEVIDLKDKLAGASEHLQDQVSGLEVMYADLGDRLYHQVKQAALSGIELGKVLTAWETVAPSDDHIKVAFQLFTPRLLREGVFHSVEEMTASVDKTAAAGMVNAAHPLVVEFDEFCTVLSKLAETRTAREEIVGHLAHLENYLKTAGSVTNAWRGAKNVSKAVADKAAPFLNKHVHEGVGDAAHFALRNAPEAAVAGALYRGKMHYDNDPRTQPLHTVVDGALSMVPNTRQNLEAKYRMQSGQ